MNIYYIDYTLEITEYSIERFCELFNGENCNFNAETGDSDEPLIAMPNDDGFIYTNKSDALKKCRELKEVAVMANLKKVIENMKLLQTVLKYELRDAIVQEEVDYKVEEILDDLGELV